MPTHRVRSDAELSNEKGKWRDKTWYDQHASKTRTPSKKIDTMVCAVEGIAERLNEQRAWTLALERAEELLDYVTRELVRLGKETV